MSLKVKNEFEETISSINSECLTFMKTGIEPLQELLINIDDWFKKANIAVTQVKKNGFTDIDLTVWGENEKLHTENANDENYSTKKSPLKEISLNTPEEGSTSQRPRRNASRAASQNINKQLNTALNKKIRRPTAVQIKKERLSNLSEESTTDGILTEPVVNIRIKEEINSEMPAPTRPAPKSRKTKQSSVKIKKEKTTEQELKKRVTRSRKASDVIIQEIKPELIEISDSDEENVPIKKKRTRPISEDEEISIENCNKKRSKSGSDNEEDIPLSAEDKEKTATNTSCPKPADDTFCLKATDATFISHSAVNTTIVIEKPTIMPQTQEDLMTDDESEEEPRESPIKPVKKNQIFSAFEQSPVKKKVEAFERLHEQASVTRVTRTKTRALAKEQNDVAATEVVAESVVKEKVKLFTPKVSKFIPKACSTQTSNRIRSDSIDSSKSASALKASQAEFRERERRRKEKEEEVLKKREALIQSQMEERKRKREEKQLKAQKQRELLEKEKQKALEAQRLKEERNNKLLAEQEERKQKLREEKRIMAMRAAEEKRKEEERRLEEQRKIKELNAKLAKNNEEMMKTAEKQKLLKQQRTVPIYMKVQAPLLPTDDCYDSDDEEHVDEKRFVPKWAESSALKQQQLLILAVGEKIKNTFFSIQAQTADLQEIFEVIAPTKLKRSSSACWHKPPRFTMLPPDLDLHQENSDDDYE